MKNEFNDSTNMVYHHNDLAFQNCKKKLNFTNINNNVGSNSLIKLPLKHEISVQNNCLQYKPSNTKRNERERKRVKTINDYFAKLQKFLPNSKQTTKKLSKVETLKAAIDYIEFLQINSKNNQLNNNGLTIFTPTKTQKESRNKQLNKLNTNLNNNNIENTNSSISSSSSSSSTISTSSCYSTPTVSPLQISHNNNSSSNSNILSNNTSNSNIQVHVNINSNNLQVPSQHQSYQHYQVPQQTPTACPTEQQTMLQYPNRTPTKSYYNTSSSSTPTSPNNHGNYYPLEDSACYGPKNVLSLSNENYNNNMQMFHQQNIINNQHYPVNISNSSTEFMHQNQNSYYSHQQQSQQQLNRITTTSTPKRNLDLTSYSTDDGIDTVNSSTVSNSTDDYIPSIYSTSSQHLVPPENTEICPRNLNSYNNNVKSECFLTDNLLLDFM